MKGLKKWLFQNGLSIVFCLMFLFAWFGQAITGFHEYNKELAENGHGPVVFSNYFYSGHFIQATFENWESEFLQMALFIVFTIFLRQKGSSESKECEGEESVDRQPDPSTKDTPWPVKKGGWVLILYKNSLSIAFVVLFLLSVVAHFYGSLKDENEKLVLKGLAKMSATSFIQDSRFWFESFQNWQSEFLSVFSIVLLSIYFRQKGSPQSKPVDAPNYQTGE